MDVQNPGNTLGRFWRILVGSPEDFSLENRTVNAVSIITFLFLLLLVPASIILNVVGVTMVNAALLIVQLFLYYLSRFNRQYQASMVGYAFSCYAALIINYHFNAGINGPTIFLFFLTFHLLIAIAPKSQHAVWMVMHILIGVSLLALEYMKPEYIRGSYPNREARFIDISSTYFISIAFVYIITIHLRNNYAKEKKLAEERADAIRENMQSIEEQNATLKRIAWLQSHKVRSQVATILGLCEVLNDSDANDPENVRALKGIKTAANELDEVIKNINELTHSVNDPH